MKKVIQTAFCLSLLFTLILTSCQKDVNNDATGIVKEKNTTLRSGGSGCRAFYDNGGTDYGCAAPCVDCLDDITINGLAAIATYNIFTNPSNASTTISNNYSAMNTFIESEYLDGVLNNTMQLSTKGAFTTSSNGYLIFSQNSSIVMVQPVKKGE